MERMGKGIVALTALAMLAACGDSSTNQATNMSTRTQYEQLSKVDWVDLTAADTAAHVNNNSLIMMR